MANIIIKNYEHYNRSLQKHISSKKDYIDSMKRGGFVSFEKAEQMVEKHRENRAKYEPSKKAEEIIRAASTMQDRKGNIKAGSRLIDGMRDLGLSFKRPPDWIKE